MGWKPGKLLKKAAKGIKKIVKKIGKGIKKVAMKLGGIFGKLGIVGQLGLMFLGIPPIISDFFGTIGGAVGQWATKLGTKGVLGKAVNAIHSAGSAIGNTYRTISEAISNGIDRAGNFLKGEGFTLSKDRTSIFNRGATKDDSLEKLNKLASDTVELGEESLSKTKSMLARDKYTPPTLEESMDKMVERLQEEVKTGNVVRPDSLLEPSSKGLGDRLKDYASETLGGVTDALSDPRKLVSESVGAGIKGGISSRVGYEVAGDPPVMMHLDLTKFMQEIGSSPSTSVRLENAATNAFKQINEHYLKNGNSFSAYSYLSAPEFTALANPENDPVYTKKMESFRGAAF